MAGGQVGCGVLISGFFARMRQNFNGLLEICNCRVRLTYEEKGIAKLEMTLSQFSCQICSASVLDKLLLQFRRLGVMPQRRVGFALEKQLIATTAVSCG